MEKEYNIYLEKNSSKLIKNYEGQIKEMKSKYEDKIRQYKD
jgi:hypothetical protein